jgi:starvation-inducible outer membrane lipoprotein
MNRSCSKQMLYTLALLMAACLPTSFLKANNTAQIAACTLSKQEQEAFEVLKQFFGGMIINISKASDKILALLSGNPRYIELCKLARKLKEMKTALQIVKALQEFSADPNKVKEIPIDIINQIKAQTNGLTAQGKLIAHLGKCLNAK